MSVCTVKEKSLRNFWPTFVVKARGKKFPFVVLSVQYLEVEKLFVCVCVFLINTRLSSVNYTRYQVSSVFIIFMFGCVFFFLLR